ncbi:MAG: DUF2341 domain-containing protein, partial [Thermoplasmatales archaeon]|nr:DUF2341 domain-containing protein [Thermoplasmatales archaeon]
TAANYVWGNSITDFSIFGPLGQEPAANTPPWIKDNTNTPANNTNNICPIPSLHVICWDNNTIDTTNATWRSNSSGPWVSFHTTSTISNNTNITATNGNFTQSNTTYWWSVNLTDGEGGWDNKTFSFTTNQKPEQANIDPWNGSTDISTTPALYVVVSDSDGDTMIAYWRYNDSNNWWTFATNTSITTITNITQTNSNFTNYSTTYYWTVNLTDGCNYTNETYHFTTTASPASLPVVITNASTGIGETNATLNAYLSSNGSADTTCGFRFGTSSGVYTENVSLGVTANLSEFSNNNQSLSKGQIYFFQAWATNSVGFANGGELTFLTKPDPTTSLSAQTNSSSMIYLTWTKPGEANTTYIERNATAVTSWARGEGTLVYNGTATNLEDSGLVNGTTYYYQAWSFANWTYNPTLTQFSDSNDSDNTTTKYHPDLSSETPTNASTGISLNPTLQITVSHNNGYLMNVSWYWGTDNSCPNYIGANNSVTNGTWNMTDSDNNFSSNGVTYYWCVKVNDGHGGWTNETYHFTTIGANKQIISKGQSAYSLEMNSGGTTLYGYINSNAVNISIDTNWHYVVLTFDGTTIKLYKDGELVDSKGLSASINTNNNDLKLGEFFTGTLDELRVSNTARNAGYINTTYNNENSPTTFATFGDQIGVLSTWDYRKKIWINASQIENDLPYFPVLISTTDNDLKNNAHLTGNDIIFMNTTAGWTTSSYTGRFPHEVEKWDKSNGELVAWVNVTSLSSTTNTSIYMYYGSSICTSDRTNANGVWDSNYVMVQHLNETSDPHGDSTSYNNDGNESGGVNQSADEEKIDGADWFDGNNDYVDCGNGTSLNIRNAVTIEAWIKMDERPDQEDWYDCTGKGNYSLYLYGVDNTETIIGAYFWIDGVEVDLWEEGVVDINPNNGWAHCVITFDGTDIKAYVNGQLDFTYNNPGTIDDSSAINLIIGAWDEANHFYGSLDEVRISNTNRSAAWINTTYNNTNDPSSFLAFGEQEIQNVAPTQSSPSPSDGATGQSLNPPLQITIADNNVDSMNVTFRTNASGPWADIDSNNTVFNGTYQQTPSNMNSYNTKYWWSANVTDGTLWNNVTYNFTTNALPVLSNPIPANGSSGISLWPACNVTVSDANGGTVDVYFYENTTGTWICNQTNSSVDVTTAQNVVWVNYSNASSSSTEYWWSVNVTDSIGWTNETYSFTTAASPFLYVFERYRFIKLSDFLPEATDKEKEYIQHIDITDKTEITNGKIRLKITEELEETTYLDRIYLRINGEQIVEIDNIKPKTQQLKPLAEQSFLSQTNKQLLKHSDNHYLILKEGDEYILEFVIPDNCHKIEFAAEGYYIEHHTHKNDR